MQFLDLLTIVTLLVWLKSNIKLKTELVQLRNGIKSTTQMVSLLYFFIVIDQNKIDLVLYIRS